MKRKDAMLVRGPSTTIGSTMQPTSRRVTKPTVESTAPAHDSSNSSVAPSVFTGARQSASTVRTNRNTIIHEVPPFLTRSQAWLAHTNQKKAELRKVTELQRAATEMEQCSFKPQVLGHNYDNSGLTNELKAFYQDKFLE